jgi:hypothetical protein
MSDQAGGDTGWLGVRATFADAGQMQDAVSRLSLSGFDRSDISIVTPELARGETTSEADAKPASTEEDARQARTLGASTAATVAALAAVGVTVATGGAAAPAIAAAVVAGGAAGGSVFAVQRSVSQSEQHDRDAQAEAGDLILAVRAVTDPKRSEAVGIMKAVGATKVEEFD